MSSQIVLTRGLVAIVDDSDYEWLSSFKWYAQTTPSRRGLYAARSVYMDGHKTTESMHRLILPGLAQVDHRDRNGLNNQRSNLRAATGSGNAQNRNRRRSNTSGYIGVTLNKQARKWQADIEANGRRYYLGLFADPVEAARARDAAAMELHGVFAVLNFEVGRP